MKLRFQFRLRTLLIGVVLTGAACGYFAHEASIVRARRDWLKGHDYFFAPYTCLAKENPEARPSIIRRLLGDTAESFVFVPSNSEADEAMALFPEAKIGGPPLGP